MHALFVMISHRRKINCSILSASWLLSSILLLYILLCSCRVDYCYARDTLKQGEWITDDGETTLVSSGGTFELGFFTPIRSSTHNRFVGIWYKQDQQTVVWVANRNNPVLDGFLGIFGIAEDGILKVSDSNGRQNYWSASLYSSSTNRTVKLMDSGNLVLSDDHHHQLATSLWESFQNPTDTVLPGMNIDQFLSSLTSWAGAGDPRFGQFMFNRDLEVIDAARGYFYVISKYRDTRVDYWRSSWIQGSSDEMPDDIKNLLSNKNNSGNYSYERIVMNYTGELQYYQSSGVDQGHWSLIWRKPDDKYCSIYNFCGNFGSCNINNRPFVCKCLPGFRPTIPKDWDNSRDFSGGCTRNSRLSDKSDMFLSLNMMKVSNDYTSISVSNDITCRGLCLSGNQCRAYSSQHYPTCIIWTSDLIDLQEEYIGGFNLSIRVAKSDIESTSRNCEPCGTNLIPYPLSTRPDCGDPIYFGFYCNYSTGQVSFNTANGTYRVVRIDPSTRKFVIQVKYARNDTNSIGVLQLNKSFFFNQTVDSSNYSSKVKDEIEVSWEPPLEPSCNSSNDCKDWLNSTCNLTRDHGEKRCLCTGNLQWDGSNLNCTKGQDAIYSFVEPSKGKMSLTLIVIIPLTVLVFVLASTIVCIYLWRRKMARRQENRRKRALRALDSEKHVKDLIDGEFTEEDKKDIDVPFFDLESILAATNNFSDANKLGEGGYGPVYKGTFSGGQQIALKRLSCVSKQGLQEFKNEVVLIAKLQHRNLVRLRGYCVRGDEKILLYEYMPNKSLDSFIFDQKVSMPLDWEMRVNIILGIARGLVYLHHDSRLRIIHRDLKTSNILLDKEMNPKISDFGLARMIEGKETEANTTRVVGTHGYMSPEYVLHGLFSVKSDVFSFGVVLLEIISGKRNTGFYQSELAMSLIAYAWKLWVENHVLDLMDSSLHEVCNAHQFVKCVNVGLLCVQEDPNERPTMSNVVTMLDGEAATVPTPKQPAFVPWRGHPIIASSSSEPELTSSLGGR